MRHGIRKGFLFLVLALLVAGGVFAQRVGDTVQIDGQPYTIRSVSGDTVTLQRAPQGQLDGAWNSTIVVLGHGSVITFSGNGAVFTEIAASGGGPYVAARNGGHINNGDPFIRNIRSTGANTWSCEVLSVSTRGGGIFDITWNNGSLEILSNGVLSIRGVYTNNNNPVQLGRRR